MEKHREARRDIPWNHRRLPDRVDRIPKRRTHTERCHLARRWRGPRRASSSRRPTSRRDSRCPERPCTRSSSAANSLRDESAWRSAYTITSWRHSWAEDSRSGRDPLTGKQRGPSSRRSSRTRRQRGQSLRGDGSGRVAAAERAQPQGRITVPSRSPGLRLRGSGRPSGRTPRAAPRSSGRVRPPNRSRPAPSARGGS